MHRHAGLALLAFALGACQTTTVGQAPASTPLLLPLFGPVIGAEVIGGRVEDRAGVVWLLAGGNAMVRVDLDARRARRIPLQLGPADQCWGLAQLEDGSMWSLKGRRALVRLEEDGRIAREIPLPSAHLGLFASGDLLLYQRADFTSPAPALLAGSPGDPDPHPWSRVTTRSFDGLARASAAALNMVSCGISRADERACWFPDEAAVALIDRSGRTRRLELSGLDVVPAAVLLTSENPPRPVRDAYIDETGGLLVLGSGKRPPGEPDQPGGWLLARYGSAGQSIGMTALSEPARLILRASSQRAVLLTSAGMIVEVHP